ncbi:DUF433 domain-containing protein [Microcoleus sp.]|uniref:DUF433 domain-containing protein n=1 Tax=Microcoleus sp. TaxID=44472 RepID=UPI003525DB94
MPTTVSVEHIEMTPGIRGGKPRIVGTRIAVEDVMLMHLKIGYSLLEIATKYDLILAAVYDAMAYYYDHRQEIDIQIAEDDAFVDEFRRQNPGRLQAKIKELKGESEN